MIGVYEDFRDGYVDLCSTVLKYGVETAPRGQRTRELISASFKLLNPIDALPLGVGRAPTLPFAAAEAAQLVAGISTPELLIRINPTMERFIEWRQDPDPRRHQHGAYGPRIRNSIHDAIARLESDNDTRQAVITVWNTGDYIDTPDVPCTLSLQFFIRSNKLELAVTMRSNDVWWGTAYDVFQFTQLQLTVARVLGIEAGTYHHHANSLHVYERDFDKIDKLYNSTYEKVASVPQGFFGTDMKSAQSRASALLWLAEHNPDRLQFDNLMLPVGEQWYARQLVYTSPRNSVPPS